LSKWTRCRQWIPKDLNYRQRMTLRVVLNRRLKITRFKYNKGRFACVHSILCWAHLCVIKEPLMHDLHTEESGIAAVRHVAFLFLDVKCQ